ncbi:MAG TPA: RCC1 domain-containing protein [Bdellovibrionota bacterium]|nr:RCC1 domain-containing protein [Bdellovibrionota bacterium]
MLTANVTRLFRIDANGLPTGSVYSAMSKPVISVKVAANDDVYVGTQGTDASTDPAKIYRFFGTQTFHTSARAIATTTVPYAIEADLTHDLLYLGGNKGLHCYSATTLIACPSWDISVGLGTDPIFTSVTLTPAGSLIAAVNTSGNSHYVVDLARGTSPHHIFRYGFIDGGNVQSLHGSTGQLFVGGSFTGYQGTPAHGIMELASDFSRKVSHTVAEVQAAGDVACAITTPTGSDRELYCWGQGYFGDVGGNTLAAGFPLLTLLNVESFKLTPGKLCAKVIGDAKWKCRGANYEWVADPSGSDSLVTTGYSWLTINELNEAPLPSLMLSSSHLTSGTYHVSPVNMSYADVDIGGITIGVQYFDALPFGCRIAGGKVYCHMHPSSVSGIDSHRLGLFPGNAWSEVGLSELVGTKRQVQDIALGTDHGCLITQDHYVHCWGINHNGQLGVGTKLGVSLDASPKALPVLRAE